MEGLMKCMLTVGETLKAMNKYPTYRQQVVDFRYLPIDIERTLTAQLEKALPIILSDIKMELEGLQNPYAFMDGNPIPKWISEFRAYGECYKDVIERLRDIYP